MFDDILAGNTGLLDAAALAEEVMAGYGRGQQQQMEQAKNKIGIEDLLLESDFKRKFGEAEKYLDLKSQEQKLNTQSQPITDELVASKLSEVIGQDFNELSDEEKQGITGEQFDYAVELARNEADQGLSVDYENPETIMDIPTVSDLDAQMMKYMARDAMKERADMRRFQQQERMQAKRDQSMMDRLGVTGAQQAARLDTRLDESAKQKAADRQLKVQEGNKKAEYNAIKRAEKNLNKQFPVGSPVTKRRASKAAIKKIFEGLYENVEFPENEKRIRQLEEKYSDYLDDNPFTGSSKKMGKGQTRLINPQKGMKGVAPRRRSRSSDLVIDVGDDLSKVDELPIGTKFKYKGIERVKTKHRNK